MEDSSHDLKFAYKYEDASETDNNGLEYTVAVLERVYQETDFPPITMELPVSLKSSGKSRQDNILLLYGLGHLDMAIIAGLICGLLLPRLR